MSREQKKMRWITAVIAVVVLTAAMLKASTPFEFVETISEGEWHGRTSRYTDGFSSLTGWTNGTTNPITITSGEADIDTDSDTVAYIYRNLLSSGRLYTLTIDVSTVTAGSLGIYIGAEPDITDSWTVLANADTAIVGANEDIIYAFYADGDYVALFGSTDANIEFDDLQIHELNARIGYLYSLNTYTMYTIFYAQDSNADGVYDGIVRLSRQSRPADDAAYNYWFTNGSLKAVYCDSGSVEINRELP